jgi:PPM family protein phosphatase
METYSITDRGLWRRENQDRYFLQEFEDGSVLAAVADGMGGEAAGGQAAQMAVDTFKAFTFGLEQAEADLKNLFQSASEKINGEVQRDPELTGMGTTLTAAYIQNGMTHWAHTGDSRLYLLRAGELIRITEDHTYVNMLVQEGAIRPEEARGHPLENILIHCIGCLPLEVSTGRFGVSAGDLLLLTTDGLYHEIKEDRMIQVLSGEAGLQKKCSGLLRAALEAGGRDNVTIVGVGI